MLFKSNGKMLTYTCIKRLFFKLCSLIKIQACENKRISGYLRILNMISKTRLKKKMSFLVYLGKKMTAFY